MSAFDPSLLPEGCAACQQRVVKVDGRCPICATLAERARAAARPAVAPGPWPQVRVARAGADRVAQAGADREVRVATVVDVGEPTAARLEPDVASPGALVVTALLDGVRLDGAPLAVGRRTPAPGGARLELPLSAEAS